MIIVASTNIFRRELASYLLAEVGYQVREARDLPTLLAMSKDAGLRALVLDVQFDGASALTMRQAIRGYSAAPILWLVEPEQSGAAPIAPVPPELFAWPYEPGQLVERLGRLLQLAEEPVNRERFVGAPK